MDNILFSFLKKMFNEERKNSRISSTRAKLFASQDDVLDTPAINSLFLHIYVLLIVPVGNRSSSKLSHLWPKTPQLSLLNLQDFSSDCFIHLVRVIIFLNQTKSRRLLINWLLIFSDDDWTTTYSLSLSSHDIIHRHKYIISD